MTRPQIDEDAMWRPTASQREAIAAIRSAMLEARRAALLEAAEMAEAEARRLGALAQRHLIGGTSWRLALSKASAAEAIAAALRIRMNEKSGDA